MRCKLTYRHQCNSIEPSIWAWRVLSLSQGVGPILAVAVMLVLPESPRYLAFKGCNEEALQVLANVNGALTDDPDVQLRYHEIIDILSYETQIGEILDSKKMLKTLSNRKRLLLALSVAHLTMLTGSNVITQVHGSVDCSLDVD